MSIYRENSVLLEDVTYNLKYLKKYAPYPGVMIRDVVQDSRQVKPGSLFVAIPGYFEDGHKYIEEAIQRGAVAIVSERDFSTGKTPYFQVPDAREALAYVAGNFYHHPSRDLSLLGITGTNGKTTTAFMVYSIFKEQGVCTGLLGTVFMDDGREIIKADLTTPDSLDLQRILSQMKKNRVQVAVMEVSSQGLDQHRVSTMDFSRGIFTNLTTEHLDFHGDFSSYKRAKARFLDFFSHHHRGLLYNRDDERVHQLFLESSTSAYTFSLKGMGDFNGEILSVSRRGIECQFSFLKEETLELRLSLLGRHNIYNALSAAAITYLENVSLDIIKEALELFQPVSRRLEFHEEDGLLIIDDTALNPASYQVVFETISELDYRDLIIVNAIRGKRGVEINRDNARVLVEWCQLLQPKGLIITSSRESTGPLDHVEKEEEEAFLEEVRPCSYLFSPYLTVSIEEALNLAREGDLLLLLGAQGMDEGFSMMKRKKFQNKEGNKIHIKK